MYYQSVDRAVSALQCLQNDTKLYSQSDKGYQFSQCLDYIIERVKLYYRIWSKARLYRSTHDNIHIYPLEEQSKNTVFLSFFLSF